MVVLLECLHSVEFNPPVKAGDEVYCRRCRQTTKVLKGSDTWSARCTACTFGRTYGTDEGGARRGAARHANALHHRVLVKENRVWRATVGGDAISHGAGEQLALGAVTDWIKSNPDHQGALLSLSNRNPH